MKIMFSVGEASGDLHGAVLAAAIRKIVPEAELFGMGGMGDMGGALSVIPLWLILLALVFATVVGVLSGIAPANRAVKISALEAIRHE